MLKDLDVKVGPQYYKYCTGEIEFVGDVLNEYKAKRVLVVHGTVSWEKAKPYLTFLNNDDYEFFFHQYTGECSYYGAELVEGVIEKEEIDFVIGVGGGKLTELVGFSSYRANVPFGVIPTLASNCAPWTALSVMYKETRESEGVIEYFYRQAVFFS